MPSIPERLAEIEGVTEAVLMAVVDIAESLDKHGYHWYIHGDDFREAAAILRKRGPTDLHRMATKVKAEAQHEIADRTRPNGSCHFCLSDPCADDCRGKWDRRINGPSTR